MEKRIMKKYEETKHLNSGLKDSIGTVIKVGDEVYWNDPAIHDLETEEERKEAWLTLWKVDEINEELEMVSISTEHSEAEVFPRELEVAIFIRQPDDYID